MQEKRKRGRPRDATSIRALAEASQVSERSVYYSKQIHRSGREDLGEAIMRGDMKIAAAIRELTGRKLPDRYGKLVLAWNRAGEDARGRFLTELAHLGIVRRP